MADLRVFINRKQELDFLHKDIRTRRSKSRMLLISAQTGIGKSALVDKAMLNAAEANRYRVSITIDKTENIEEGYVWKQITQLVHRNAQDFHTYSSLYKFLELDKFYKNVADGLIKAVLSFIKVNEFTDGFGESRKKIKENVQEWLGDDKELLALSFRYLSFITQKHKIFLAIDNFQAIDNTSLFLLRNLMADTANLYVIGECTIIGSNSRVPEFVELFDREDIEVNHLRLDKLDKRELINSIEDEKEIIIGIIETSYDNSDGNLHKFQLLRNSTNSKKHDISFSSYNNITKYLINNLDDASLGLIIIIYVHQGEVPGKLLDLYLQYSVSFEFLNGVEIGAKIQDLQELGFIKSGNGKFIIQHDSVSLDLRDAVKTKRIQLIAIRNWIRLYQQLERNSTGYEIDYLENLLWQVIFILKIEAFEELPDVLEKIYSLISTSPTYNIIFQLEKITQACKQYASEEAHIDIFRWLIIMYYRCGYSDKVVALSSPFLLTDDTILLCYLAALSTISHQETFQIIDSFGDEIGAGIRLGLILVKIRTLRSADDFENCKKLWLEHYLKKSFEYTSFEAGFLKYCTLAEHENYQLRIDCCNTALELFKSLNDRFGQVSTCIALSRDHAYIGNFTESRRFLEIAESSANKVVYPRYQLYNNRAMLDIITDNITQFTKDALNNALQTCSNGGDKLILRSNILVIAIIENDIPYGYTIYQQLLRDILNEFDAKDTIIHLCLYNCYRYALTIGETAAADDLFAYLEKLELRQDIELWNYLIYDRGENRYPSVIKKQYYPCFMLGWDLDYYIALSNFQQSV